MNRRDGIMTNHIHIAWTYKRFLTMLKFVIFFLLLTILYGKTAFAAWDFNYTGNVQSWTCPVTGTYKLEVWGAQAGYNYFQWGHNGTEGAQGGYATGEVTLSKGTTLYICVGGRGGQSVDMYGGGGGYNGGAKGGDGNHYTAGGGSGGGGATHIALNTNRGVLSNYSSNQNEILVVAGGGGGSTYSQPGCAGGDSHAPYHFGQGQNANNGVYNHHEGGGGGGGGWYGGQYGSDEAYRGNYGMGPAHGGSNYVKDSLSNRSTSNGGRSGNGFARITSVTRYYNVNLNILNPDGKEAIEDGNYGYGYVQISYDGKNWSSEVRNEPDTWKSLVANTKIYIKCTRPYYDYLEFGSASVTNNKGLTNLGNNTWCYTVSDNEDSGYAGGVITIHMNYKHTALTLNPNGGSIDNNTSKQTLSPLMQYGSTNWCYLRSKIPTRPGYKFLGWYDAPSGGTKVHDEEGTCILGTQYFDENRNSLCTKDLTLYAHWEAIKLTVKFDANASNVKNPETVNRYYGTVVGNGNPNLIENYGLMPTRIICYPDDIPIVGDTTLKDSVNVKLMPDGNLSTIKVSILKDVIDKASGIYYLGNKALDVPADVDYTFAVKARGNGSWLMGHERFPMTATLTNEYTTYHVTDSVRLDHNPAIIFYSVDRTAGKWIQYQMPTLQEGEATLPEITRPGYKFLGWYTERTGGRKIDPYEFVTEDVTYYAHWQVITYKIDAILMGGTASGIPKTYTIEDDFTLPNAKIKLMIILVYCSRLSVASL